MLRLVGLFALLLIMVGASIGRDMKAVLFAPLTGERAVPTSTANQWIELSASLAANITDEWNTGDTFSITVWDTQSSRYRGFQGAELVADDSDMVVAILIGLSPDELYDLARFLRLADIPCIAPSRVSQQDPEQHNSNFFSIHPLFENVPEILSAFRNEFEWDDIALLVDEPKSGLLNPSIWNGTRVKPILATPSNLKLVFSDIHTGGYSVMATAIENVTLTKEILRQAEETYGLFVVGDAWIVFGNPVDYEPIAGVFYVDYLEIPSTNVSRFQSIIDALPAGSGRPIEANSAHLFDAISVVGLAIRSVLNNPTNLAVRNAIASTQFLGMTGAIRFLDTGFRRHHPYKVWNAIPKNDDYHLSEHSLLYFSDNDRLQLVDPIRRPVFPGPSHVPPNSSSVYFTVTWLIQPDAYELPIKNMSEVVQFAAEAVNGRRRVSFPVPLMPHGYELHINTWSIGSTPMELIPVASNLASYSVVGVLSDSSSEISKLESSILTPFKIIQLSDAATSPDLSDKEAHPYFLRTIPPDNVQAKSILTFCKSNRWTEVGIIHSADSYGVGLKSLINLDAANYGIRVAISAALSESTSAYEGNLANFVKESPRVVLIFAQPHQIALAYKTLIRSGSNPRALITSDTGSYLMLNPGFYGLSESEVAGWVSTAPAGGRGEIYEAFKRDMEALPSWSGVKQYYTQSASWCVSLLDSVFVYADAMKRVIESGGNVKDPEQLLAAMKTTDTQFLTDTMKFDVNGDRVGVYEIANYIPSEGYQIVGHFRSTTGEISVSRQIVWPDGTTDIPIDVDPRQQKWLKWLSPQGIVFSILASVGIIASIVHFIVLVHQKDSPVVRVATWQFLLVMVVGCAFGYGSMFTWIGKPQPYICALRIWLPPMSFILIMAPLLTKTWRLHRIFTLGSMKIKPFPLKHLAAMCSALAVVQVIICIFWISMGTIQPKIINDPNDKKSAYVVCGSNRANQISAFVTYAYLGLLMLVGCYLTFKVRKLPKDFNESRWIGFAIYNTLLFSVVILTVGYSLSKFPITVMTLIVICTYAIATGAMCFMVVPKIWILIFHPERRSSSGSSNGRTSTTKSSDRSTLTATKPTSRGRHDFSVGSSKPVGPLNGSMVTPPSSTNPHDTL